MLPAFLHIDLLFESYVLQWFTDNQSLVFELDIALFPVHPRYTQPTPEEWTCYQRGQLIFENCTEISGLEKIEDVAPATDASGEVDYDHIEMFEVVGESTYLLVGTFGRVLITSSEPGIVFASE